MYRNNAFVGTLAIRGETEFSINDKIECVTRYDCPIPSKIVHLQCHKMCLPYFLGMQHNEKKKKSLLSGSPFGN